MPLSEACNRCGQHNQGSTPEPTGNGVREITFECDGCGSEGIVNTHTQAGILSRTGEYFQEPDDDDDATCRRDGCQDSRRERSSYCSQACRDAVAGSTIEDLLNPEGDD